MLTYIVEEKQYTLEEIENFFNERIIELKKLSNPQRNRIIDDDNHSSWIFSNCCNYLAVLGRLIYQNPNPNKKPSDTEEFDYIVNNYLYPDKINTKIYCNGVAYVLNKQFYSVLRCGILHSFSLKATNENRAYSKSLVLDYKKHNEIKELHHFTKIKLKFKNYEQDSIVIFAEEFVEDIEKATKEIFNSIKNNKINEQEIIKKFNDLELIKTLKFDETTGTKIVQKQNKFKKFIIKNLEKFILWLEKDL